MPSAPTGGKKVAESYGSREEKQKQKLGAELINRDCSAACSLDIETPFTDELDVFNRLLPLHVRSPLWLTSLYNATAGTPTPRAFRLGSRGKVREQQEEPSLVGSLQTANRHRDLHTRERLSFCFILFSTAGARHVFISELLHRLTITQVYGLDRGGVQDSCSSRSKH
jgi:hypothetical protein